MRQRLKKISILILSLGAIVAAGAGIYASLKSPLFTVQVVEIGDQPENSPLDAQQIAELASVPVGKVNLFDLDLKAIERRLLTHEWVRSVRLQKRFPQTLLIAVDYRKPRLLLQREGGRLAYVDSDGKVFGKVNLAFSAALPMLSGTQSPEMIQKMLALLDDFEASALKSLVLLSALSWDAERGYRLLVSYRVKDGSSRTMVELGESGPYPWLKLEYVIKYLSQKGIAARQISADSDKKIVVKTVRTS